MHSTKYIIGFVLAMTSIVALLLTSLFSLWKEKSDENEAIFNKRSILKAVGNDLGKSVDDLADEDVKQIFSERIDQKVLDMKGNEVESATVAERGYKGNMAEHIDMAKERKLEEGERLLPLFVYNKSDGGKYYILSVRGNGLWDEIWGNIALSDDQKTVVGATFDHKAETPGLGAEIKDNPAFAKQFEGKKIYSESNEYTSVIVKKGGARNQASEVDGISGATVTGDGVTEMLVRGIKYYEPYFKNLKKS